MFSANTAVLFFGADTERPFSWNPVSEMVMDETNIAGEQSKIFATMRTNQTITLNCSINKEGIRHLMEIVRRFNLAKGPARNRMIRRAKKMQTNYISTYTFRKEGDEYVDERGAFRLVLQ